MARSRIVVTGMGAVTPVGITAAGLVAGPSVPEHQESRALAGLIPRASQCRLPVR